jgi:hypothetical protein
MVSARLARHRPDNRFANVVDDVNAAFAGDNALNHVW